MFVVTVARKPVEGTVAANSIRHGTGSMFIDGCRISYVDEEDMEQARVPQSALGVRERQTYGFGTGTGRSGDVFDPSKGRWPANVILTETVAHLLDEETQEVSHSAGGLTSGTPRALEHRASAYMIGNKGGTGFNFRYGDKGGVSRFFKVLKCSS